MPKYSLKRITDLLGLEPLDDGDTVFTGVGEIEGATPDRIAFVDSDRFLGKLHDSAAGIVLVPHGCPDVAGGRLWRVDNPRLTFLRVAELFVERLGCDGLHPDASIHPDARLGDGVAAGPCAVISAGARIGSRSCIGPGAFVGEGVVLGEDCLIEANASLLPGAVLGNRVIVHANASIAGEGFGYVWLEDHHHKIPQLGRVEIGDDVEIGCSSCVDRATLGVTRIGRGCKIDNQVHVAHNCTIGEHVILVAQVGLSGSVSIGPNTVLAGKVGVVDHIHIGSRVMVGGRSTVTKDVGDDRYIWGWPARDIKKVMREQAAVGKLPELVKQVKQMGRQIEELQVKLAAMEGADIE